jgi:hypothetical protein
VAENFLSAWNVYSQIFESPSSFWRWSGFSTISSIMRDRCYIRNGKSYTFPNLYILLLAESSGHRKNRPIEDSESLVASLVGTRTISGRSSVQAILDELSQTESNENGVVLKSNAATYYAPELSAGIVGDTEGLKILTDIYDFKQNTYKHRLRTGRNFDLKRLVLSMFSGSNEKMLKGFFDESIIGGGFLARTLLVIPNEFRKSNSLMRVDYDRLDADFEHAKQHLKKVQQVTGEFHFAEEAIIDYESWYNPFREEYNKRKETTGIIGRIHTHVLKLSMILAANDLTTCIQKKHIEESIEECCSLLKNYNAFTMSNAKTDLGNVGGIIVLELASAKDYTLSRKAIVRAHWQNMDIQLFEKAVEALKEAGMIELISVRSDVFYRLTPTALEMMR